MAITIRLIWQKNWLSKVVGNRRLLALWVGLLLTWSVFAQQVFGFGFADIIHTFEVDFKRTDPLKMRGRYESIIADITEMKVDPHTQIVFKSRGDVKQEYYQQDLKTRSLEGDLEIAGYEFLLRRLAVIEPEYSLVDILRNSEHDRLYGFYNPSSRNVVIMEGSAKPIVAEILFHELVHASQDAAVNLNDYLDQYCSSFDACSAARGLIEGQASAVNVIFRVEQDMQNREPKEILKDFVARMQGDYQFEDQGETDFFANLNSFPYYYGLHFVLRQYLDESKNFSEMFDKVPESTEQVLHFDKFQKNEKPVKTLLEKRCERIASRLKLSVQIETTLGENYLREILASRGYVKRERALRASEGWGGDRVAVLKSDSSHFFIWDTMWDRKQDAKEFYESYLEFSKMRLPSQIVQNHKLFDAFLKNNNNNIFLKRKGKRVVVIEGKVSQKLLKGLNKALKI